MATLGVVPNAPKTPNRVFRAPDDLWRAAQDEAVRRGETVSDVLRRALVAYVDSSDESSPGRSGTSPDS